MTHLQKIRINANAGTFAVADLLAGFLVTLMAFWLSPYNNLVASGQIAHATPLATALLVGTITSVAAHVLGLHDPRTPKEPIYLSTRACASMIGRYILLQVAMYLPPAIIGIRWVIYHGNLFDQRRVCLIGSTSELSRLQAEMPTDNTHVSLACCIEDVTSIQEICASQRINEVVVCRELTDNEMTHLLECQCAGINVRSLASFEETTLFRIPHDRINSQWFLYTDLTNVHATYRALKRLSDIVLSLCGAAMLLPVFPIIILLIRLDSRGPAFFSQTRTGQNGVPFKLWKFRSMRLDAEKNGPQFAGSGDRRVTRLGTFLRKSRLDETPQFWNILKGDMSFIGPRPERPEFVRQFCKDIPFYQQRHIVKPGLTGWAQINYPYGATTADAAKKLQLDLYYIKHMTAVLDIQIILRTVGAFMRGAR